jgi:glycerate dehydrogenase
MKIVVLDGYTLNPGDLDWGDLERLGECVIYDRTAPEERLDRVRDAEIVLTNKVVLDRNILRNLPKLKFITVLSTGVNVVELEAAREQGIPVANVPEYGTQSVAQMTMALLLELALHVGDNSRSVREGRWASGQDWCYWDDPLIELDGLEMGIVGFGRIGSRVASLAKAFGMQVSAYETAPTVELPPYVRSRSLEDLLDAADVVSLHCPLTSRTQGIVNSQTLELMKRSAFLINTSRGGLVREHELAEALNEGQIAGAALDVLSIEPPQAGSPLIGVKNCIVTPHISWATGAARHRLMTTAVANVKAFLEGKPQNVVN